jgi:hypothetical protein
MKRILILILGALGAALASVSVAAATTPQAANPRTLRLDAYSPGLLGHTQAVYDGGLINKALYVATVQGTISYYAAIDYLAPQAPFQVMCGTPVGAPQFGSAGGSGKVGNDAEFIFAIPSVTTCASVQVPRPWLGFQIHDDGFWTHPDVLSAHPLTRPTRTHAYEFALVGHGNPVGFRLSDPDTRDDYGSLRITVRRALPSDCGGDRFRVFGLRSRAACVAHTAPATTPPPRTLPLVPPLTIDQAPIADVLRDSDVPIAVNQEVAAGALSAGRFAEIDSPHATAAIAQARSLTSDGLTSAAISEFTQVAAPQLKSTALRFRSVKGAGAGDRMEVSLAAEQAPPRSRMTIAPDPALAHTTLVTFTPTTPGAAGGVELINDTGLYVDSLLALQAPDLVTPAAEQALLAEVIARR